MKTCETATAEGTTGSTTTTNGKKHANRQITNMCVCVYGLYKFPLFLLRKMEVGLCVGLRKLWCGAEVRVGVASTYAEGGKCVVSAQKQNPTQFTSLKFCFTDKHFPSKTHINLLYTNTYAQGGWALWEKFRNF